jgi:hypothetical protein
MRGRDRSRASRSKGGRAVRTAAVAAWAVAFFLTIGLGGAFAGTRLIAHFENDNNADTFGRDVLATFYDSQGVTADVNLYRNLENNLASFPLPTAAPYTFTDGGSLPPLGTDPFEIHQFPSGGPPGSGPGFLVGENRFAAFGSGWSLGAQDQVEDFQLNFINVDYGASGDPLYDPGTPGSGINLADNAFTGTRQDWSGYDYLCFYLCINASDIPATVAGPDNDFWDSFKVQVWVYDIEPWPLVAPYAVTTDYRGVYEVSLTDAGVTPFTGWRHIRIPFSSFQRLNNVGDSWRYTLTVSQGVLDDGVIGGPATLDATAANGSPIRQFVRAVIFRKGRVVDTTGNPTEPDSRITVAIDEITVTGSNPFWAGSDPVLRVNIPGTVMPIPVGQGLSHEGEVRCDDNQDRGLCWAQVFANYARVDDPTDPDYQVLPYRNPVKPATGGTSDPKRNVDVVVTVGDWQQLWATFSAEVGTGAVVSDDPNEFSSEIVFVPQFQAPGTWVERWNSLPPDALFLRRKGTIQLPGPSGTRHCLFYTDWRYDYPPAPAYRPGTSGDPGENYLVRYHPAGGAPYDTPFGRLDPSTQPRGGFLANYLRDPQLGYAYGTLFVLPRDNQGNIGRAQVIDVLFEKPTATLELRKDQLITGRP